MANVIRCHRKLCRHDRNTSHIIFDNVTLIAIVKKNYKAIGARSYSSHNTLSTIVVQGVGFTGAN